MMQSPVRYLRVLFGLAALLCCSGPVQAEPQGGTAATADRLDSTCNELTPCLAAFGQTLERLRQIMGKPQAPTLDMGIYSAAPYDSYFLAQTLLQRTNRLAFETLRVIEKPPLPPPDNIQPDDALALVREAYRTLGEIMAEPQIAASDASLTQRPDSSAPRANNAPPPKTTTAFATIVAINRQLDLLLERRYLPGDVYMEVTLAVAYAAQLLAHYDQATRLPEEPRFEPAKQPGETYLRLLVCLESISRVYKTLGLEAPEVTTQEVVTANVTPGDVFLIASLVVAQLDFLHRHLAIAQAPRQPFYPGVKFPSHVYQRAALLQSQLRQLEQAASGKN